MGFESLWMFDWLGTVLPVFFVVVLGIVVLSAGKEVMEWSRNKRQPVLTVGSRITARRTHLQQRRQEEQGTRTYTFYYVTFEVESGDRMEFKVTGEEYGQCSEGDEGRLTFQGTRYIGFQRLNRYSLERVKM
ncbi:DUF2500 domain-containing protein [Paenibacillus brasilensis]|uniref:DUF2500 domain-containing protein n=1 Tax=Paenibacillus brasilensis TaxID=128574 RepID=A0ABU0KUZ2_9BACL|nr:DUF2500 domain-containing protein [Paenibacillus brasilensis]MDQ0493252.1 hypothetical protein [Paenibacillus brasilensis]